MERMRDVLKGTLGQSLKAMCDEDRVAAAWPVACGRAMAERGKVIGLEDGVVQVAVTDMAWLGQMRAMSGVLQSEMARISGVGLSGIHFELKQK